MDDKLLVRTRHGLFKHARHLYVDLAEHRISVCTLEMYTCKTSDLSDPVTKHSKTGISRHASRLRHFAHLHALPVLPTTLCSTFRLRVDPPLSH